jgi:hypothetical protein
MLQLFYLFIYERSPTPLLIQKNKKNPSALHYTALMKNYKK